MEKQKLEEILRIHAEWLEDSEKGERADLREADLQGADLQGADLQEAENIFQFGPMPTSRRIVTANWHGAEKGWIVYAGCFTGGLDELEAAVKAEHNCPVYLGIIEMLRKWNPEG